MEGFSIAVVEKNEFENMNKFIDNSFGIFGHKSEAEKQHRHLGLGTKCAAIIKASFLQQLKNLVLFRRNSSKVMHSGMRLRISKIAQLSRSETKKQEESF